MFCAHLPAVAQNALPADNDDSYKLPLFVPKAALPKDGGKVIFDDKAGDNDEIYSLPKRAALKPSDAAPAAGGDAQGQKSYSQQYEEYQQQMKLYNEQMVEYKKQLAAQQTPQTGDNDTSYVLPGQYSDTKKTVKPPHVAAAKPKPQPAPPPTQAQPAPQQPVQQYKAPPAIQYNQKYNYSDQNDRAPSTTGNDMPNYYY